MLELEFPPHLLPLVKFSSSLMDKLNCHWLLGEVFSKALLPWSDQILPPLSAPKSTLAKLHDVLEMLMGLSFFNGSQPLNHSSNGSLSPMVLNPDCPPESLGSGPSTTTQSPSVDPGQVTVVCSRGRARKVFDAQAIYLSGMPGIQKIWRKPVRMNEGRNE